MKQPRPTRPRPRSSSKEEPRDRGLLAARTDTATLAPQPQPAVSGQRQLIDLVLRLLSSFRFRLIFVPLRLPPLPSPRLRPPAPALALLRKGRGLWPSGQLCRDEPQRPQLPYGLSLRGGPTPRRDRGDALREVQPGRAHPLHPGLQGHDHPPLLGLRVCELPAAGGRGACFGHHEF